MQVNKVQYDNCKVLDKSGALSFYCDQKKALWYLKECYANKISDKPLVVQFNWNITVEPFENDELCRSMKCLYEHESYLKDRENVCAVCGKVKEFARFQTLPILYKSHLPKNVKVMSTADVLILCQPCHERAVRIQDRLKLQLADQFGFSLGEKS